jgi:hypothetical protein
MQARTPHAWPSLYASAAFLDGLTGAMACALLICTRGQWPSCRWRHRRAERVSPGTSSQGDQGPLTVRYRSCPRLMERPIGRLPRPIRRVGSASRAILPRPFTGPMVMCMSTSSLCPPRSVVRRATTQPRSSRRSPRPSSRPRRAGRLRCSGTDATASAGSASRDGSCMSFPIQGATPGARQRGRSIRSRAWRCGMTTTTPGSSSPNAKEGGMHPAQHRRAPGFVEKPSRIHQ